MEIKKIDVDEFVCCMGLNFNQEFGDPLPLSGERKELQQN